MKIAFSVVRNILWPGGIEKYTAELGSRLVARGHEVTVYSMANHGSEQREFCGMRIVPCATVSGKFGEKLVAGGTAALKIISSGDYDILHQHSIAAGAFNWLARRAARASVLQMHGVEWRRTKWGRASRALIRGLERTTLAQYRNWTAVSRSQCRILSECYGIDPVYIPTATDVPAPAGCDIILREHGLMPGQYALFASRLVPEKGAHFLIEAFRRSQTNRKLVIAGDAPNEPQYVGRLRQQAAGDPRVMFLGTVQGRKLQELFSNCFVYVQPSVVEGLSIALLEAMSYGRCCLVSDIEENREAIADCGATFKSENPDDLRQRLDYLLDNPTLVRTLGHAARERVRLNYSWSTVTDQIEGLYRSMLASSVGHRVAKAAGA